MTEDLGVGGSPAVRGWARALVWVLIVLIFVAPIVLGLLLRAL